MKAVVLYGTGRHGTTWRLTRLFLEGLEGARITEFFLPRDFGCCCNGCMACVIHGEGRCPHRAALLPLLTAIDEADLIVLASPVYVMGESAGLRQLFEHFAYRWMVHRPEKQMFSKVGVCISTAAGPCTGGVLKSMARQLFFQGVPRTFRWGEAVGGGWDYMSEEQRQKLARKAARLARKVNRSVGHARPGVKTRALFGVMRQMQKHGWEGQEIAYWDAQGWLGKGRPWKA